MNQSGPIDYSGLVVKVTPVPGAHLEHFGTPVQAPASLEIELSGQVRIALDYNREPCVECQHFDGFRCAKGLDTAELQALVITVVEENTPLRWFSEELDRHITILALVFTQIEPSFALAEVLVYHLEAN